MNKKEMINNYKQLPVRGTIFQIKNLDSGRILIDSDIKKNDPLIRVKAQLKMNAYKNKELQKDWNELGEQNFSFLVLDKLEQTVETHVQFSKMINDLLDEYKQSLNERLVY